MVGGRWRVVGGRWRKVDRRWFRERGTGTIEPQGSGSVSAMVNRPSSRDQKHGPNRPSSMGTSAVQNRPRSRVNRHIKIDLVPSQIRHRVHGQSRVVQLLLLIDGKIPLIDGKNGRFSPIEGRYSPIEGQSCTRTWYRVDVVRVDCRPAAGQTAVYVQDGQLIFGRWKSRTRWKPSATWSRPIHPIRPRWVLPSPAFLLPPFHQKHRGKEFPRVNKKVGRLGRTWTRPYVVRAAGRPTFLLKHSNLGRSQKSWTQIRVTSS